MFYIMDRRTKREMGIKKIENAPSDDILDWCDSFIFSLFIIILVFMFVLRIVEVDGSSMYSTLEDKDTILITHMFSDPKQGDIVVLNSDALDKTIIKRVIGTAGQTVEIDYNTSSVYVDGQKLDESYLDSSALSMRDNRSAFDQSYYDASTDTYKYTVPEGYVFVLGDNRNNSTDSRMISCVPIDHILGKAFIRVFPIKKFGTI